MKRALLFTIILVLAISLSACGQNNEQGSQPQLDQNEQGSQLQPEDHSPNEEESNDSQDSSDSNQEEGSNYPLTITDASGFTMVFEEAPQRIVSLSPSETEVLFALGLEDRIVGVTEWCDFPEAALHKPKVGSFDGNPETIIAAEPDLVVGILSLNNPEYIENYRQLGLTVYTSEPANVQEAMDRILLLGQITDTLERAEQIVAEMTEDRDYVVNAVTALTDDEKKSVFIEYNEGWTVGKGEFMDELITLAGGINIAEDMQGWVQISEETIIERDPDVIIHPTYMAGIDEVIKARNGWEQMSAVVSGQIYGVDDDLISRPGPRLTKGLIEIGRALYPDLVTAP